MGVTEDDRIIGSRCTGNMNRPNINAKPGAISSDEFFVTDELVLVTAGQITLH